MPNITTCLWFDKDAEEAANFYVKVFTEGGRSAKVGRVARYGKAGAEVSGQPEGTVMTVAFELDGNQFLGLNGGNMFKFSMATSFIINCTTQKEVDHFYDTLLKGGKESQCGWLEDRFGVSWQIIPTILDELITDPDHAKSERVMKAMLEMKKLDIATLTRAAEEK